MSRAKNRRHFRLPRCDAKGLTSRSASAMRSPQTGRPICQQLPKGRWYRTCSPSPTGPAASCARLAHLLDRNWGAWHGALVFMLALPIALWLAGQGLGAVLGTVGNVASGLNVGAGQAAGAAQGAAAQAQANPTAVGDTAAALRNTLWGAFIGSVLGLGSSALGGWLGAHHLLNLTDDRRLAR